MPNVALPKHLESYPDDARQQVRQAVEYHQRLFGQPPRGMWPSEGSVCQGIVPVLAEAGVQWIGTDEEILSCSTDGWVSRDNNGFLRNPEMLYRPWRVEEQGKSLQIVFRDHAMSDQIGFHYYRYAPEHAVGDFIGKLEAIGNATGGNAGNRPTLVSIILDGENCWEYYPNAGVEFLRGLYRGVVKHAKLKPVRVGEYLARWPAADKLGQLFPGSWIQHNFGIWIGHPECNQAWDLLHETRRHLAAVAAKKSKPAEKLAAAWKEMSIAEGSDWFWWFGDSHQSAQSGLFDRLFRKHLQNVYLALDEEPPTELARPIRQGVRHAQPYTEPTGLLRIKVDGRRSYFEWINAGHYVCGGSRGAMSMVTQGLVSDLYFGFDAERLFVRLDSRGGPFREQFSEVEALRVVFVQPEGLELSVLHPSRKEPKVQLRRHGALMAGAHAVAAAELIFELAVPFRSLGRKTDEPVHFYVELLKDGQSVERIPHEGAIETTVPSPDYELIMWQA